MNFLQQCLNYKGSSKSVEELLFHFMTESPAIGTDRSINQLRSYLPKMTLYFICRANVRLVQREPSNTTPKSYTYLKGYKDGKRLNVKKIYLGGGRLGGLRDNKEKVYQRWLLKSSRRLWLVFTTEQKKRSDIIAEYFVFVFFKTLNSI